MSTKSQWDEMLFTIEDERLAMDEAIRNTENSIVRTHFQAGTRWIGKLLERQFDSLLTRYSIPHDWRANRDPYDYKDFTIGVWCLDVKGVGANWFPKENYRVNVNKKQMDRIKEQKDLDFFVFGRYVLPENRGVLLGWLKVEEFAIKSRFIQRGESFGPSVATTDMYDIGIEELKDIHSLIDLSADFDDVKPSRI